jgi:hypothetical protein
MFRPIGEPSSSRTVAASSRYFDPLRTRQEVRELANFSEPIPDPEYCHGGIWWSNLCLLQKSLKTQITLAQAMVNGPRDC